MAARVAVVGGGLAGISAALALQETGAHVELLESRPRLGGATHSFSRGGLQVDNGQHVFLRCCTAYQGLLDRLGVAAKVRVQDRFDVPVRTPDGRAGRLRRARLPGPLHLVPALASYELLSPADRLRAVRASLAMQRLDPEDPALDSQSLGDWLAAHGQRERGRTALWELFVVAALNIGVGEAVLGPSAMVIQTALLGRSDAADIGVPLVPLGELHGESARRVIERRGGRVHVKAAARSIEPHGGGLAVEGDGFRIEADAVVVAVPHEAAADLVPEDAVPDRDRWRGLGASPIVNVHVVYDRPVTGAPFTAAVDSPAQWVFDRTEISGLAGPDGARPRPRTEDGGPAGPDGARPQYLAVSVSAAERWIDVPTARIREEFVPALRRLFPAARDAVINDMFVTRERRATFRQAPGSGALRPPSRTGLPGLFLAGAWTATGWPDTMEGAVRSGLTAARLARDHLAATAAAGARPHEAAS